MASSAAIKGDLAIVESQSGVVSLVVDQHDKAVQPHACGLDPHGPGRVFNVRVLCPVA